MAINTSIQADSSILTLRFYLKFGEGNMKIFEDELEAKRLRDYLTTQEIVKTLQKMKEINKSER